VRAGDASEDDGTRARNHRIDCPGVGSHNGCSDSVLRRDEPDAAPPLAPEVPSDLAALAVGWADLSPAVKAALLLVKGAGVPSAAKRG
jgi:hypothetical protein